MSLFMGKQEIFEWIGGNGKPEGHYLFSSSSISRVSSGSTLTKSVLVRIPTSSSSLTTTSFLMRFFAISLAASSMLASSLTVTTGVDTISRALTASGGMRV